MKPKPSKKRASPVVDPKKRIKKKLSGKPKVAETKRPRPVEIDCPVCFGEGKNPLRPKQDCLRCEGAGKVKSTRPEGSLQPTDNGNHPGGRTPKYDPATVDLISEGISRGMTDQQAADLAGIALSTLQDWFKTDAEFSGPIKKARSERLLSRLRYIEGANENWTAIAWLLERAHGTQFAPPKTTVRNEHALANGMSDEALKKAEEMLSMM